MVTSGIFASVLAILLALMFSMIGTENGNQWNTCKCTRNIACFIGFNDWYRK